MKISLIFVMVFYIFTINLVASDVKKPVSTTDSLNTKFLNWYNLDPLKDKIQGASVYKLYSKIKNNKPKKKIIVAIIDSGVDIDHEDLKDNIWINKNEIPNNGIDDDNNGYIDDIHGWNFLGNSKGENINVENIELTRIYRNYSNLFKDYTSINEVPKNLKEKYKKYLEYKKEYNKELATYTKRNKEVKTFEMQINICKKILKDKLPKEITIENLKKIKAKTKYEIGAKKFFLSLYENGFDLGMLKEMKENIDLYLNKHLNISYQPRKIINDDLTTINTVHGNSDVKGKRCDHGTFTAGIIGAVRNNNMGVDGIANHVELMILRAVPKGDEYDKDIALSIKYAVDNGANIINMSFGKNYSPNKKLVDEAVQYAQKRNVLLVHAAGNSSLNIDKITRYPSNKFNNNKKIENWINVGASSCELNKELPGVFSNFGRKNVDLFAPGVNIVSTHPENKYNMNDGTSFAAPVVSGVAALVWSYFPELTAKELKNVLLKSVTKYKKHKVYIPNITNKEKTTIKFKKLSKTGGLINAFNAFERAEKICKK